MSIRQRKSKKSATGFTYQVYFNYVDSLSGNRKKFSKSGFLSYEDAQLYEKKKKILDTLKGKNDIIELIEDWI